MPRDIPRWLRWLAIVRAAGFEPAGGAVMLALDVDELHPRFVVTRIPDDYRPSEADDLSPLRGLSVEIVFCIEATAWARLWPLCLAVMAANPVRLVIYGDGLEPVWAVLKQGAKAVLQRKQEGAAS